MPALFPWLPTLQNIRTTEAIFTSGRQGLVEMSQHPYPLAGKGNSECGPCSSDVSSTWEFVRKVKFWVPPQTYRMRISGSGALESPLGDSDAHSSFSRSTLKPPREAEPHLPPVQQHSIWAGLLSLPHFPTPMQCFLGSPKINYLWSNLCLRAGAGLQGNSLKRDPSPSSLHSTFEVKVGRRLGCQ